MSAPEQVALLKLSTNVIAEIGVEYNSPIRLQLQVFPTSGAASYSWDQDIA